MNFHFLCPQRQVFRTPSVFFQIPSKPSQLTLSSCENPDFDQNTAPDSCLRHSVALAQAMSRSRKRGSISKPYRHSRHGPKKSTFRNGQISLPPISQRKKPIPLPSRRIRTTPHPLSLPTLPYAPQHPTRSLTPNTRPRAPSSNAHRPRLLPRDTSCSSCRRNPALSPRTCSPRNAQEASELSLCLVNR